MTKMNVHKHYESMYEKAKGMKFGTFEEVKPMELVQICKESKNINEISKDYIMFRMKE